MLYNTDIFIEHFPILSLTIQVILPESPFKTHCDHKIPSSGIIAIYYILFYSLLLFSSNNYKYSLRPPSVVVSCFNFQAENLHHPGLKSRGHERPQHSCFRYYGDILRKDSREVTVNNTSNYHLPYFLDISYHVIDKNVYSCNKFQRKIMSSMVFKRSYRGPQDHRRSRCVAWPVFSSRSKDGDRNKDEGDVRKDEGDVRK